MATTKKMSAEDKALERFTEMMISKIETIKDDWHKPWFTEGVGGWAQNLDGREYNGGNAFMLIMLCEMKGYKLPVFATFDRIDSLNYFSKGGKRKTDENGDELPLVSVTKGEKAFPVFLTVFNVVHKDDKTRITFDEYKHLSKEEQENYIVYSSNRVYLVFNVAQTNIETARPDLWKTISERVNPTKPKQEGEMFSFPEMDDMISTNGWYCPIMLMKQDSAHYNPKQDKIVLPLKEQFAKGEDFYSTAFHEMAHSTGHASRLNREGIVKESIHFGDDDYAKEELVAEMTAAIVGEKYGIKNGIQEQSAMYLKNWLKSLHEKPKFIKEVLFDVKRAASAITQRVKTIE